MKNLHSYLTILIIILFTTGTSEAGLFGDRDFDGSDLSIIASSFGTSLGSPGFNSDADLDSNGVVDNNDLSIFASFLGLSEKIFIERKSVMIPAVTGGKITISEDESLYSQGFELIIPPNALSQDTVITVGDSISDISSPPDGLIHLGLPIGLKPEGLTFSTPVTIKLHYSDEEMISADISDTSALKLAYFDSLQSQWVEVPVIEIDEVNKIITAEIDHFSWWNPLSWFENKKADEDPATPSKILDYIKNTWGIVATNEEIEHVLYDDSNLIPYSSEIGGLLTVLSMKDDIDSNNFTSAIKKGTVWLLRFGLKESGYKSLSAFAGLASTGYDLLNGYAHILDKGVFNAQVSFYVHYRKEGMQQDEIIKEYTTDNGWILRPGGGTFVPILTGKFHPVDVYVAGEATYQTMLAEVYLQDDEQAIKSSFLQSLTEYQTSNNPSASFSISPEEKGNPPFTVNFDPSSSSARNDSVIVEYVWDFDDGTQLSTTSSEEISHTFFQVKTYNVELKVKDNNDKSSKVCKRIVVTAEDLDNHPPEADFNYSASSQNNLIINFDASLSNDPDGNIIHYEWFFGDGNTATGRDASNAYYENGDYKVLLKVTDDNFKTTTTEQIITATFTNPFYMNNFEGYIGNEWSNTSKATTPAGNRHFLGMFSNDNIKLSLDNIPLHDQIILSFDLFIIETWDGNGNYCCGPDIWELSVTGGQTLINTTFSNTGYVGNMQTYPDTFLMVDNPARAGATANNTLGFRMDTVYHMHFTFQHTKSDLELNFSASGLQTLSDESWGIDNVKIEIN